MIRYKLKDRELQAAYEKCLKDFDHHLQIACEGFDDEEETVVLHHLCKMTDKPLIAWELTISKKEIEPVEEYDPHAWNNFPQVTPPEGVPMRVEYTVPFMTVFQRGGIAVFEDGLWYECTPDGRHKISQFKNGRRVVRFRPWDDEI